MQNPLTLYCPQAYPPPYSIPPHAYFPPILSHPIHTLPPILSLPVHTLPLFYPSSCTPSPYSIRPHACPLPILSQPMHALSLFSLSPHMPPQLLFYSIPAHACPPNSLSHIPWRHVSPLTSVYMPLLNLLILSHTYSHLLGNLEYHFISLWHLNVCCFHSHELTTWATHNIHC